MPFLCVNQCNAWLDTGFAGIAEEASAAREHRSRIRFIVLRSNPVHPENPVNPVKK